MAFRLMEAFAFSDCPHNGRTALRVSHDFLSDTEKYDIWLPESEMQIGEFVQQLVLEVLSVLPVKQELQVRQVQSVLRVLDLYLCSYDSLPLSLCMLIF